MGEVEGPSRDVTRSENWYRFDFLPRDVEFHPDSDDHDPSPESPFDSFVEADKNTSAYTAHSYPTKVPPEAIERFIQYYTTEGDIVLDPFCGSGMTGLAAQRNGRRPVLSDLSPLAAHLAYNHTIECDPQALTRCWEEIRSDLDEEVTRLYGIDCDNCHSRALIRYTIWSDVYACPDCGVEINFWEANVDPGEGTVDSGLECRSCGKTWRRSAETRVAVKPTRVAYNCSCGRGLRRRALREEERERALSFDRDGLDCWYPSRKVEKDREMYKRSALHLRDIETIDDFYTSRNLNALALLWDAIGDVKNERVQKALAFAFTNTAWHGTKMRRYNARGGHRPLTGTLYIPQLSSEANVFDVFGNKVSQLSRFYTEVEDQIDDGSETTIKISSATNLDWIPDDSIDYIFTDPPFGSNIFYADCNLIAESWLGRQTDPDPEAVINRSQDVADGGKTLDEYQAILTAAFSELYRVVKPGRWATIAFQSSDGEVWSAIREAVAGAGFTFASANGIDKGQKSMKGYKGRSGAENVPSFDILLHLRKEPTDQEDTGKRLSGVELRQFVVDSIREHLGEVPSADQSKRTLPYLYSYTVRQLLNNGYSVADFSMEKLRTHLDNGFTEVGGRWYRESEAEKATASA